MYLYNRTTNISEEAHDKWLDWMRETHIPAMLASQKFLKAKLIQVLIEEEMGGITYSEQYTCESRDKLNDFLQDDYPILKKEMDRIFKGHFVSFETKLKLVEEFTI